MGNADSFCARVNALCACVCFVCYPKVVQVVCIIHIVKLYNACLECFVSDNSEPFNKKYTATFCDAFSKNHLPNAKCQ